MTGDYHRDTRSSQAPLSKPLLLRPREQRSLMAVAAFTLILLTGWQLASWLGGPPSVDRPVATRQPVQLVVSVNRADLPELCLLPRIGPTLARRIVQSRELDGPFLTTNDLQRVRGIGPITAKRLESMVSFD